MNSKNLFTIGEVAKAVDITRKTILNYEAKGLVVPDKKDGSTGNRYYTIDTLIKVRTIRILQNLGLTLDEIREYYSGESDLKPMIQRLEKMRDELNITIEKLKERARGEESAVKKITIEPQTVYCRTHNSVTIEEKTVFLRNTALEAMREYGTDTTRRMYFIEYSVDEPNDFSYCVAIPPESKGNYVKYIPELKAISFFHHGAYEDIPEAIKKLADYAEENDIRLTGTFRNLYLEGPPHHKDKSKFITQVIAMAEY